MFLNKLIRQTIALTRKNLKLQYRNGGSTATQLLIGIVFLLLLLFMDVALRANTALDVTRQELRNPPIQNVLIPFDPPCFSDDNDCLKFVYTSDSTGIDQTNINNVVNSMLSISNFTIDDVKGFDNITAMDEWLLNNKAKVTVGVVFENSLSYNTPLGTFDYTIIYNQTRNCIELGVFGCSDQDSIAVGFATLIDSGFIKTYSSIDSPSINVQYSDFPHPALPVALDVTQQYGTTFLYIALTFNYVIQLNLIVKEKELHLVESMRQMGLNSVAYWFSWYIVDTIINTLMVLLLIFFGWLINLELFRETSFWLLFVFFWLSSMSFTALGFFFSTLTRKTSTARLISIGLFIVTFIASPILIPVFYDDPTEDYNVARIILSLFPFFGFYDILGEYISGASGPTQTGLTWDDRLENTLPPLSTNLEPTIWTVENGFIGLVIGFFIFSILTWYLDQVIPTEHGRHEPFYFFLLPSYWGFYNKSDENINESNANKIKKLKETIQIDNNLDDDVKIEAEYVKTKYDASNENNDRDIAIEILGLSKRFGQFIAVNKITYGIDNDQCFVLLGHNGAGKTTTINMLTGLSNVSSGDAFIFGHSVKNEMETLFQKLGVCPQHDILWGKLTAREHLEMFSRIKGIPEENIESEVDKRIKQVKLESAQNELVMGYSGGMKRRLSIAIAFIGDPKFVVLDEPTTGMDPVTRREVWTMINEAKKGRVILLTTHSMEEADVLGDRIAVMSKGKIQAIGNSIGLKNKFGSGYRMSIITDKNNEDTVTNFMNNNAPENTTLVSSVQGSLLYQIPKQNNSLDLVPFFELFEKSRNDLKITDYSIGLSSLENVFLNLSKEDEVLNDDELINIQGDNNNDDNINNTIVKSNSITINNQINAMLRKSITYQYKQKLSCCAIVCAPVAIMLLLLLVQFLLFDDLKFRFVCGGNSRTVTRDNCATAGYNLDCIAEGFEFNPAFTPSIEVGTIELFNGRNSGINPNCDTLSCYVGLEIASFENISMTSFPSSINDRLGFKVFSGNENDEKILREFYSNIVYLLSNNTCTDNFNDALNDDLQVTLEWKDKNVRNSSSLSLGACLSDEAGEIQRPSESLLDQLDELENERDACTAEQLSNLWTLFTPELTTAINSITNDTDGLLQYYTTDIIQDNVLNTLTSTLLGLLFAIIPSNLLSFDDLSSLTLAFACTDPTLRNFLNVGAASDILANFDLNTVSALCAYATNQDKVRLLSTQFDYNSQSEFLDSIYERWGGVELQTDLMNDTKDLLSPKDSYKQRQYTAQVQAYEFHNIDEVNGIYNYTIYYNNSGTSNTQHGNWYTNLWSMENAIVTQHTNKGIKLKIRGYPTKFECNRDEWLRGDAPDLICDILPDFLQLSILDFVGSFLFPYLLMLHAFIIISLIVYEKENRLTIMMKMHGLNSNVYWIITYLFYLIQFFILSALLWIMGSIGDLKIFTLHSPGILLLFFFSWGNLLVIFSFLLSVFFSDTTSSTAFSFLGLLIVNTVGSELLTNLIQDINTPESSYASLMWLPPLVMIRVILWFSLKGAFNESITFANWRTVGNGAIPTSLGIMWIEWFVCLLLLYYLDKVYIAGFGVREKILFCLDKNYWFPPSFNNEENQTTINDLKNIEIDPSVQGKLTTSNEQDNIDEYNRVIDPNETNLLTRVVRLHKRFDDFVAVKSLSFGINKAECFGLLGHNGAGKTTAINMLTGLFAPSNGTAVINNFSIKYDLSKIRANLGVCPQHDILWDSLSVEDHLKFYGRLKGLTGNHLINAVDKALVDVNLKKFKDRAASKLSGGMKRRLSVAISLIGDPTFILLDEPSTGLDVASKRRLWQVISRTKGNKSIILTTHSMEEADVLCDRVGIMALGEMQAIGLSSSLKQRYGAGYTCTISTDDKTSNGDKVVNDLVTNMFPTAKLLMKPLGGVHRYEINRKEVVLSNVFKTFEKAKEENKIKDWGLTETTLEEVFLKLAQLAKVEEALTSTKTTKNSCMDSILSYFNKSSNNVNNIEINNPTSINTEDQVEKL